jgi:hypothetical protein
MSFVAVDGGLTDKEMIALTERLSSSDRDMDNRPDGSDPPAGEVSR